MQWLEAFDFEFVLLSSFFFLSVFGESEVNGPLGEKPENLSPCILVAFANVYDVFPSVQRALNPSFYLANSFLR